MIALAAHEEEGPGEALEVPQAGTEGRGPNATLPGEPTRTFSSHRCAPETGHAAPTRECRVRPPWTFLEEFRLGLLSARVRMFDRERFPAC